MNIEERTNCIKLIEQFCKITEDMIPRDNNISYILRASLNCNEVPDNIPNIVKSKLKSNINNIFFVSGDSLYSRVSFGVTRSGLNKEFASKKDFINSPNAQSLYDPILIALYNKYRKKAIEVLKEKLSEIEKLEEL